MVDLRPGGGDDPEMRRLLIGRAGKLERLGLACGQGPAVWSLRPGAEKTLRDLSIRTDIIKTMQRAMSDGGRVSDTGRFALHGDTPADPIRSEERRAWKECDRTLRYRRAQGH